MVKSKFCDCNVHPLPEGKDTVARMINFAKHLGYQRIIITLHSDSELSPSDIPTDVKGIEVYRGIEVKTQSPSKLNGLIGKYRKAADFLSVHGGNEKINRLAVENPYVDCLMHPLTEKNSGLNHVLAKEAVRNNVAIEFNMDLILKSRGGRRVYAFSHFKTNLMLARKYGVATIVASNSRSIFHMRAPREMIAISQLFGMNEREANDSISTIPGEILDKNCINNGAVFEGVKIIE